MKMPLEGIRVIEWGMMQQAPFATQMLGDYGAEVIKIEDRITGDAARGVARAIGVTTTTKTGARNFYFECNNRNKKSVTVDITKEKGKQIVYDLIGKSDVFIQNFRLGAAKRAELGYETLSKYNPKLIYVNTTGIGPEGPEADAPILDPIGLARSGFMTATGEPQMPPVYAAFGLADQAGAVMAYASIVTALLARERLGVGQEINTSLLAGMMTLENLSVSSRLLMGRQLPRMVRSAVGNPLFNFYRCADDKWIQLSMLQSDRHWDAFCEAMGIGYLSNDPRCKDYNIRAQHCEAIIKIMDETFATKPRAEWFKILGQNEDFIFGPINDINDLPNDPQVLANNYIIDYDHPVFGKTKLNGFPFELTKTPASIRREAPEFGQHTEEVLTELLGYSWDKVVGLKNEEVI
ncbi:MAG: CoA transferase [Dehalococcoidia bacterium]|nr:CoA transferase [Dehalococcoidia bacterium]